MSFTEQMISEVMTPMPHSIDPHEDLELAFSKMRELKCHHLPVLCGGRIIGMLSDRDLLAMEAWIGPEWKHKKVEEAMLAGVETVDKETTVQAAAELMFKRRVGSVLVKEKEQLLGIFTSSDALRLLSEN